MSINKDDIVQMRYDSEIEGFKMSNNDTVEILPFPRELFLEHFNKVQEVIDTFDTLPEGKCRHISTLRYNGGRVSLHLHNYRKNTVTPGGAKIPDGGFYVNSMISLRNTEGVPFMFIQKTKVTNLRNFIDRYKNIVEEIK